MSKTPEISEKNKKTEILDAYFSVLQQLKEQKHKKPKEEQKRKEEVLIVKKASEHSYEGIVKGLAELKFQIGKSLEELEENMVVRFREFTDLQSAIEVAQRDLEKIYGITSEAESLEALIQLQKEMKHDFEVEMDESRAELDDEIEEKRIKWENEQNEYDWRKKEERKRLEVERKREEEEYNYSKKISRQKENDAYEAKKATQEKELIEHREQMELEFSERERHVKENEQLLQELQQKVDQFPDELLSKIESIKHDTEERVKRELQLQMELSQKEIEGERKLFQQNIKSLETKIKELEQLNQQLSNKSNEANQQVQDIAMKAIEGASMRSNYGGYVEVSSAKSKTVSQEC